MANRPNYAARAAAGQTNATFKGPRILALGSVSGAQNFPLTYPLEKLNTPPLLALLFLARSAPVEKSNRVRKSVDGAGDGVLLTAPSPIGEIDRAAARKTE
jgi:hypothetical protein